MRPVPKLLRSIVPTITFLAALAGLIYAFLPKGPRDPMAFRETWHQSRPLVEAKEYAAVAGTPWATDAAMAILEKGGNAFDAAAASLLALNVTHCEASSFPGIAPLMIYDASTGEVASYVGAGTAPAAATIEKFAAAGKKTVPDLDIRAQLLPASPDVLISLLRDRGTMSFADVSADAIRLAREGFPVHHIMLHNMDLSFVERLGFAFLFPYNAKVYFGGQWWRPMYAGDRLKLPDLAATLEAMAAAELSALETGASRAEALQAARDYFYKGPVSVAIADFHAAKGGFITAADLARYSGGWEKPLRGRYKNYDYYTNGTWSQGAVGPLVLQILDGIDLAALGHNSPRYVHVLAQAIELAMADRDAYMGDPAFVKVPIDGLLDPSYAAHRRSSMTDKAFGPLPAPGVPAGASALPRQSEPAAASSAARLASSFKAGKDTSHIAIVDRWGNAVSLTPSDFPKSPMIPGTGLTLGNRMTQFRLDPASPNALVPGKRPRVTPHAAIVFKDGGFYMAIGTPGDDMQAQALVQVFLNMVVFGMDLQTAIDAPRFRSMSVPASFAPHEAEPGTLLLEGSLYDSAGEGLRELGYTTKRLGDWDNLCGAVGAVIKTDAGLQAGSDPREETWAEGR